MLSKTIELETIKEVPVNPDIREFDSQKWLAYFKKNRDDRIQVNIPNKLEVKEELHKPLIRSLQRFQIGETGDGLHLKQYAKKYGDSNYLTSVDLFVKEEQNHAQILSRVILALDGKLLAWHWTDFGYITLRRMLGLKTELMTMFIAEVIGKCFYKRVFQSAQNSHLEEVFSLIVLDELMHLEFHTQFLATQMKRYSKWSRIIIHFLWCLLFYAACLVFVLDHEKGLKALDSSASEFLADSNKVFLKYSRRACLL